MYRCDGGQRRSVDRIQHPVNALQIIAHTLGRLVPLQLPRTPIQLPQIGPGTKSSLQLTVNNDRMSFALEVIESLGEPLEFFQCERTNLVAGLAMQGQLDRTVPQLPRKRLTVERFHSQPGFLCEPSCPLWLKSWTHEACFTPYISSISSFK